ncbi:MAG: hypothetical protein OEW12_03710 [Deltaproteobacteria bacterium]|nr:hypothetical protein [Deltaproteobacteria bacterium]
MASNPYASSFLGEQPNEQSHQILKTGLSTLMLKLQGAKAGDTLMGRAKAKHRAYHDAFPPSLLDSWLESFLTAAARFDPKFTPEMEAIWRSSLSPILDEMKHSLSSFNK